MLLIGVISSALRLEGVTVNVTIIIIGLLLVVSVVSTSVLDWVSKQTSRRKQPGTSHTRSRRSASEPRKVDHDVPLQASHRARSTDPQRRDDPHRLWRATTTAAAEAAAAATRPRSRSCPKNLGNPYFDVTARGGEDAVKDFGGTFDQVGPQEASPDAQVQYINTAAQQGVNALVVSANDPDGDL